jgi:hypothetical protein
MTEKQFSCVLSYCSRISSNLFPEVWVCVFYLEPSMSNLNHQHTFFPSSGDIKRLKRWHDSFSEVLFRPGDNDVTGAVLWFSAMTPLGDTYIVTALWHKKKHKNLWTTHKIYTGHPPTESGNCDLSACIMPDQRTFRGASLLKNCRYLWGWRITSNGSK